MTQTEAIMCYRGTEIYCL